MTKRNTTLRGMVEKRLAATATKEGRFITKDGRVIFIGGPGGGAGGTSGGSGITFKNPKKKAEFEIMTESALRALNQDADEANLEYANIIQTLGMDIYDAARSLHYGEELVALSVRLANIRKVDRIFREEPVETWNKAFLNLEQEWRSEALSALDFASTNAFSNAAAKAKGAEYAKYYSGRATPTSAIRYMRRANALLDEAGL